MAQNIEPDKWDWYQYKIFRIVLFVLFLAATAKLLDAELHLREMFHSVVQTVSNLF
jgi:hypothetical protein